jgi:hypothetical protein
MAVITPVTGPQGFIILRQASAQANTGQTDWVAVPPWAVDALIFLNITAVAGTTPIVTPDLLAADPVSKDDAHAVSLVADAGTGFTTPPTAAGQHLIIVGPGVTGIANDIAMAATGDSTTYINAALPALLGVKLALDRGTADETYTYNLSVQFRNRG